MSSILKSLRKIEEQKRSAGHAAPDLSVDQGTAPAKSSPLGPLLAGIALGAVAVGLLFFGLSKPAERPAEIAVNQPSAWTASSAGQGEGPAAALPASSLTETAAPAAKEFKDTSIDKVEQVPVVVLPAEKIAAGDARRTESGLSKAVEPAQAGQNKPALPVAVKQLKQPEPRPAPTPVAQSQALSPQLPDGVSLQLTEIFYQQDSASSMAVVNDLPVMVGSQVDSAVVTEIREDSVLVTIDDKLYTLALPRP